ncbi:FAD/NAD(P)-binding domain-containing protein [Lindgomyces ingoldianus]|uniref:FAD/NAD(P)-binding domain-containing protein n=1 Tax=Lindgomyces ingoldianus TaxID=673940 RepID=A0ACB6QZP3_9PLEO|nr:FAD/NAD(P)-binding domain-containing protein [Lindgomyces ingoldianus]KAF2472396.1 FAD/NAD(P)-binding domain-containing protein [Lindgomyces ingoldianus]
MSIPHSESTAASEDSHEKPLRVVIIGGGIGGLALAQLLRGDDKFQVTLYERGELEGGQSQLAGFRIMVALEMLTALRDRLPKDVLPLLEESIGVQPSSGQSLCMFNEKGKITMKYTTPDFRAARSVSRWKLRKALLVGSESFVKFGKEFESYKSTTNGVTVIFKDGERVECDLLVGADGAGSKVRKQLLPKASRSDTKVTVIYFKMPLTPETECMMPYGSGCLIMAPRRSMIVSSWKNPKKHYGPDDLKKIDGDESFLMCGLGCYTNEFVNQTKHPDDMTPEELKDECLARTQHWHPLFRSLIAKTIPESVFVSHIKTQDRISPWKSSNVTLLGDAAHSTASMTPYLGKGATSALFDALQLANILKSDSNPPLSAKLARYEGNMLKQGFSVADKSMSVHKLVFNMGKNRMMAKCRDRFLSSLDVVVGEKEPKGKPFPGK